VVKVANLRYTEKAQKSRCYEIAEKTTREEYTLDWSQSKVFLVTFKMVNSGNQFCDASEYDALCIKIMNTWCWRLKELKTNKNRLVNTYRSQPSEFLVLPMTELFTYHILISCGVLKRPKQWNFHNAIFHRFVHSSAIKREKAKVITNNKTKQEKNKRIDRKQKRFRDTIFHTCKMPCSKKSLGEFTLYVGLLALLSWRTKDLSTSSWL